MKSLLFAFSLVAMTLSAQAKVDDFDSLIEESAKAERTLKSTLQKQLKTNHAGTIKKESFKATGEALIGNTDSVEHVAVESSGEFRAKGKKKQAVDYEGNQFQRLADEIKEIK